MCIYIYIYIHTHIHIHIPMYVCVCIYIYIYICIYIYIYIYIHICVYIYIYIHNTIGNAIHPCLRSRQGALQPRAGTRLDAVAGSHLVDATCERNPAYVGKSDNQEVRDMQTEHSDYAQVRRWTNKRNGRCS